MELDSRPRSLKKNHCKENFHPASINLYKTSPDGKLTLEECEDLFRQRLEAYAIFEKSGPTVNKEALRNIKSYTFKTNCIISISNEQQYRQDHYSHMLTRLYCVYQPSLWPWFKSCEKRLFNYRLRDVASSFSGADLENILKSLKFEFDRVIGSEYNELKRDKLICWDRLDRQDTVTDIFKVRFVDALKFVSKRSVSLQNGYAFLTRNEIISVVCDVFERHLESELHYARQHLDVDFMQTQLLIDSLNLVYQDYRERIEEEKRKSRDDQKGTRMPYSIDIEDLDELVKNHYPPCMRHLQEAISQDNHLKHQGRLHYGAFLKSGGVGMDDAIEFWRAEFTKKIPNDKFERDYKYNIRHLYGKEGHKKELTCFSCDKIINDNPPGPGERHGCPFKHFDDIHLRTMLAKHGVKEVDVNSIFMHREQKDHKIACSHYFKSLKGDFPTEPIKNPIHFYYESRRLAQRPKQAEAEHQDDMTDAPSESSEMEVVT